MMQDTMADQQPPVTTTCNLDDLYMHMVPPPLTLGVVPQLESNDGFERQLLHLQERLCDTPFAPIIDKATAFELTVGETTRASHMLLGIITSITTSASSSAQVPKIGRSSQSAADAATIFLVAACYARILRKTDALASRLRDMVSLGDEEAQRGLPCMQIGGFTPTSLVTPAIQTSMLIRLLSQSLREIEKRFLPLTRAVLGQPTSVRGPFGDSLTAANSDIANLEAHVKGVLNSTLQLLK